VTATAASRFFERRLSRITRAFGSPKTPRTTGSRAKAEEAMRIPQPSHSLPLPCHPTDMTNSKPLAMPNL
jgi:hypothetical protein